MGTYTHLVRNMLMLDSLLKKATKFKSTNPSWQKKHSPIFSGHKKIHVYPSKPIDPLDGRPPEVDATQSKPAKLAHFVFVGEDLWMVQV